MIAHGVILTPPPDMSFGINLWHNAFEGDILVHHIATVTESEKFGPLTCDYMLDDRGGRKGLKKEC